jgi:diguanylate cyclase (GGDEF)-like protein/PAS domain S-box-containing protein
MTSLESHLPRRPLRSRRVLAAAAIVVAAVLVGATAGLGAVTWLTLAVATLAVMALMRTSPAASLVTAESFRRIFHDSPTGMVLADLDLQVLDANAAFAAFLGREIDEIVGHGVASYTEPGDMLRTRRSHNELLAGTTGHYSMEKRYIRADGSLVWGELTVSLLRDDRGRPRAVYAQIQDISGRRQAVEALDRRARYNEAAAELGRIALVAADIGELAERLAEVVTERLGADACTITEVSGMDLHHLAVHGEAPGRSQGERWTMRARSLAGLVFSTDGPLVVEDLASGDVDASAQLLGSGMRSAMGVSVEGRDGPAGMVAVFTREPRAWTADESAFLHVVANVMGSAIERAAREAAAVHRALHDPLTGLPNRDLFSDRLALTLARARRGGPLPAVLIADLDQFKLINDSLGHHAGDELLRRVAPLLAEAVRDTDTVARFGGDEFVVLCDGVASEQQALELAQRLATVLDEPIEMTGGLVYVSASFGVAFAGHESDAEGLLRDADAALYRAKARGRGRCELFDAPMRAQAMARLEIETGLRVALGTEQLEMHYQPVVDLDSGDTLALEALMRWRHPVRGSVSPGEFIPVAEESGLIVALGRWALNEACAHAAALGPDGAPVSVNLSARQLAHPAIVDDVAGALQRAGLPPARLWLELTETALFEEADAPLPVLHELKDLGVALVLDDFGTGYSSLAYLQRFPLDALKIDRAFVAEMTEDPRAAALVEAIATMARSLGLTVVPEGIETGAQREALLALGCRYGQGFLFGRPQPPSAYPAPAAAAYAAAESTA